MNVTNLNPDLNIVADEENGDPFTQLELGKAYYYATHIENNCYEAFQRLSISAEQGNREAQFSLGDMYALGHGVEQSIFFAHEWYRKSALQDYPKALARIHHLYEEDRRLHSRGELNSEEEGMNEKEFKKENNVRELNEYRLIHSATILGNTIEYFYNRFNALKESKTKDKNTHHEIGFHYQHGYGVRKISKRAMDCYTSAATQGHPSAQYNLGLLYQSATKIKFNYNRAFKWYTLAAESGHSEAQNCLGYFYEKGLGVDLDLLKALHWYTQAAENNNKDASLNIARMYRKGVIDNLDHKESIKWYITAAEQGSQASKNCLYLLAQTMDMDDVYPSLEEELYGIEPLVKARLCSRLQLDVGNVDESTSQLKQLAKHALIGDGNAMLKIGFKYMSGTDLTQDKDIGFKWIKNAARSDLIEAQLILGKMYKYGQDGVVKQDYIKASIWYSIATKKKNAVAQYELGLLYLHGHGMRKDPLEASRWFTWSADQDNSDAQYLLGVLRLLGIGLRKDISEAFEWFIKSASQKNTRALYHLGKIYWTGIMSDDEICIYPDKKRAFSMYKYAANHGNLSAQILIGRMYEEGEYVERDVVKSIEYYTLAADLGDARLKYKLGCLYLDGVHVEQDYIKAYKFIRDAAKCNYYEATCLFDTPITCSESIPDYSNVLTMFQRAVEYKLDDLEYNIGYAYENGLGNYNGDQAVNINFALALEWYLKAEQKNDARAIYRLGKFYENGKGTTQDLWTAQRYYIAGTNFRNPDSMYSLAYLYLEGSDSIRDMPKAFYLFFNAANMGHQESRLLLAPLFGFSENDYSRCIYLSVLEMLEEVAESGNLVVQDKLGDYFLSLGDKENAVKWYKMAVRGKITETYYKLAKIYGEEGFYHNSSKAINLYELAMVNQHTESIFEMAKIYHYGIGISPDLLKAYQLYTDASDRGHKRAYAILNITSDSNDATGGDAVEELRSSSSEDFEYLLAMYEFVATDGRTELQYKVGYIYEKIIETPKYEKAIKWYLMAVDGGHKESAYRLGLLYKKGLGTPQNWSDAIRMFESAMNNGSSSACFELGLINHHGNGVTVDTQKALEYYRKAANNNDLNGQYMMGRLYEDGEFVQSDFLEAIRWYKKAYVQVNDDAVARLYDLQNDKLDEMPFYRREFHILQYFASHHEGKRDEEDPDSYGHMYFRLGCIYLDGTLVKADYERAWGYFHIALEGYNNKDALRYITITNRHLHGSEMLTQNKKLEMFDAVMNILDKDLLYEIAVGYYDQICPADCDTLHITDTKYGTVFKYFIKAFEKGCSKAGKYLGDMWYYGEGVESNNENALKFHRDWAGHQNAQENYQTGYKYYEPIHCEISADKTRRKSNSIAFVYFEIAASHDIGRAQLYLTDMYYYGNGVEKDQKKAIEMYRSYAIDTPHWENFLTGIRYYTGNDTVRKNYDIALVYFDHSRLQGNNDVLKYLGEMYCYGIGTEIDKEKALDYYGMLSARQNHTENTITGLEYLSDTYPFQRNDSIAIIFLEAASTGGNYLIKRRLGDMYYYGKGAQKNREKALDLHEVYSDHCDCVKNLSICLQYYHGDDDTKKSYSIAFKYARTAVSQGSTKALLYLGDMYYFGQGIKQNRSSAMTMYRHFYSIQGSRENIKTGLQYYRGGDGVIKNREVASVFFKRVALQESTADLRQLGDLINNDKDNDTRDVKQAREYYKNAAYQQSIITNYRIGTQYYIGNDGTDEDILVAHIFFDMATRQQKIKYQNELADTLYFSKGDYMDRTKAIELYKECANLQSHRVNLSVGLKYYGHNDDMEENNAVAFIYFNEAAHQGNIEANRYLGDMYYYGQGIKENKTKAMELYDWVASQQGIIENMNTSLQYCSDRGKMKKNYTIALQFLSKLPYKNKYNSHRYLAEELYYGKHIVKNQEKAIQQFKASADIFPNEINTSVGNRYYFGKDGYGKDYSIAFIYLSRAAEQGNGDAQLRLGDMYYFGVGTNKDQAKATRLFKASSNQFDALKNTSIGLEYYQDFERKGKSLFIALIYLLKAAEQGNTTAKEYVSNL